MGKVGRFCRRRTLVVVAVATGVSLGLLPVSGAHAQGAQTLEQAFDNVGITSPANPTAGNFDGIGDSFDASALAEDALVPGGSLLHDGLQVTWPDVAPGQPDNVVADGQTVALSGQGSTLGIVGASAYGSASGAFTVTYANGSTTTANVTFADWVNNSPAGGTDFLATTGGWDPDGTIPVSLSLRLGGAEPEPTGGVRDAADRGRRRRQERQLDAHFRPHYRVPGRRGRRGARRALLL